MVDAGDLVLVSLTPDELTVAYTRPGAEGDEFAVSDRESVKAEFPSGRAVPLAAGFSPEYGAALSEDGLDLIVVRSNGAGLARLSRRSRGAGFSGSPDPAPFERINSVSSMSGAVSASPVLTVRDTLYFSRLLDGSLVQVSALLDDGSYDFPYTIDEFTLGGAADSHKLLSGIAPDERSVYLFDQGTGHSYALFRSRPDGPFYDPVDFGPGRGLTPNSDCSVLYSSLQVGKVSRIVRQVRSN